MSYNGTCIEGEEQGCEQSKKLICKSNRCQCNNQMYW